MHGQHDRSGINVDRADQALIEQTAAQLRHVRSEPTPGRAGKREAIKPIKIILGRTPRRSLQARPVRAGRLQGCEPR